MSGAALRGFGRAYMNSGGSPAWTRKEGKSPSGGLNEAGRKSYKRDIRISPFVTFIWKTCNLF